MVGNPPFGQQNTLAMRSLFAAAPEQYRNDLLSPEAMRDYFTRLIRENAPEMRYPDHQRQGSPSLLDLLSVNDRGRGAYQDHHNHQPCPVMFAQAFRQAGSTFCALDSPTTGVLVPWGDGVQLMEQLATAQELTTIHALLRRAQRYTVAVYHPELQTLLDNHAITLLGNSGQYGLDIPYYDATLGLVAENQGLPVLIN